MPNTDGRNYDFPIDKDNLQTTYGLAYHEIPKEAKVIDLGCATGNLIEILAKHKKCTVTGLELDEQAVEIAKKKGLDVERADIENDFILKEFESEYDFVLLLDIIEHLQPYPSNALKKIANILNDRGKLIISTPNLSHVDIVTRMLHGELEYTDAGIMDKTHLHFYSKRELVEFLWENGFICESIKEIKVPLGETEQGSDSTQFHHTAQEAQKLYTKDLDEVYQIFCVFSKRAKSSKLPLDKHLSSLGISPQATSVKIKDQEKWNIIIRYHTDNTEFLTNALYSVAAQTYKNRSVILVGHTDDESLVREIDGLLQRINGLVEIKHTTATTKRKRGHPLNVGLENCDGKYVSFLDYDDIYYPFFGSVLIEQLRKGDHNFAYGNSIKVNQEKIDDHYKTVSKTASYGEFFNSVKLAVDNRIPLNTYVYNFDEFSDIRFDEELDVIEDWDFLLQLLFSLKITPSYINIPVSEYFIRNDKTNSPLYHFTSPDDIPNALLHARNRIGSKYLGRQFCMNYEDAFRIYPDVNCMFPDKNKISTIEELQNRIAELENDLYRIRSRKYFKIYNKIFRKLGREL